MIKSMGLNAYRFSISWSRVLPRGRGELNQLGVLYYNRCVCAKQIVSCSNFLSDSLTRSSPRASSPSSPSITGICRTLWRTSTKAGSVPRSRRIFSHMQTCYSGYSAIGSRNGSPSTNPSLSARYPTRKEPLPQGAARTDVYAVKGIQPLSPISWPTICSTLTLPSLSCTGINTKGIRRGRSASRSTWTGLSR